MPIWKYSCHRKKERFQIGSGAQIFHPRNPFCFNMKCGMKGHSSLGALIAISPKKKVGGGANVAFAAAPDRTGAAAGR
jgi:hypothetical protein